MDIGILGSGNIGGNVARLIVRAGHRVRIANASGPAALAPLLRELGGRAASASLADTVAFGELVLLAVPWVRRKDAFDAAGGASAFAGKTTIDAMNPYGARGEVLHLGQRSSEVVAAELGRGARVVKAFNTLAAAHLVTGPRPPGASDRIALPMSGDDARAKEAVAALLGEIGFDTLDLGPLAASAPAEPNGALYGTALPLETLRARLR